MISGSQSFYANLQEVANPIEHLFGSNVVGGDEFGLLGELGRVASESKLAPSLRIIENTGISHHRKNAIASGLGFSKR